MSRTILLINLDGIPDSWNSGLSLISTSSFVMFCFLMTWISFRSHFVSRSRLMILNSLLWAYLLFFVFISCENLPASFCKVKNLPSGESFWIMLAACVVLPNWLRVAAIVAIRSAVFAFKPTALPFCTKRAALAIATSACFVAECMASSSDIASSSWVSIPTSLTSFFALSTVSMFGETV